MLDFVKELNRLIKALGAFQPKKNPMVASIKAPGPEIKPLINTAPAPTNKLPGLAPASKKDPKKVVEQLQNPNKQISPTSMIKIANNGQWELCKAARKTNILKKSPSLAPIDAVKNDIGYNHNNQEQSQLIHGLDLNNMKPVGRGVALGAWVNSPHHQHDVIIKNSSMHPDREKRGHLDFSSARREVMYHNLARDFFGMGDYVPTTAVFHHGGHEWSAQKRVPNASHVEIEEGKTAQIVPQMHIKNPQHAENLINYHNSGVLHKVALMDNIMGHHDRHRTNYLLGDDRPKLHLIDNGTAFDYKNFDPRSVPQFHDIIHNRYILGMGAKDDRLHPLAAKWLLSLNGAKVPELFSHYSYPQDSDIVRGFKSRLNFLQNAVRRGRYENVESLLNAARHSSGPTYQHERTKKVA